MIRRATKNDRKIGKKNSSYKKLEQNIKKMGKYERKGKQKYHINYRYISVTDTGHTRLSNSLIIRRRLYRIELERIS